MLNPNGSQIGDERMAVPFREAEASRNAALDKTSELERREESD